MYVSLSAAIASTADAYGAAFYRINVSWQLSAIAATASSFSPRWLLLADTAHNIYLVWYIVNSPWQSMCIHTKSFSENLEHAWQSALDNHDCTFADSALNISVFSAEKSPAKLCCFKTLLGQTICVCSLHLKWCWIRGSQVQFHELRLKPVTMFGTGCFTSCHQAGKLPICLSSVGHPSRFWMMAICA